METELALAGVAAAGAIGYLLYSNAGLREKITSIAQSGSSSSGGGFNFDLSGFFSGIGQAFLGLGSAFGGIGQSFGNAMSGFGGFFSGAGTGLGNALSGAGSAFGNIKDAISNFFTGISSGFGNMTSGFGNFMSNIPQKIGETGAGIGQSVSNFFVGMGQGLGSGVIQGGSAILGGIQFISPYRFLPQSIPSTSTNYGASVPAMNFPAPIADTISNAANYVVSAVGNVTSTGNIQGIKQNVQAAAQPIVNKAVDLITASNYNPFR